LSKNGSFLTRGADLDDLYFDNFAVFGRDAQADLLSPTLRSTVGQEDPYAAYHRALDTTDATSLLDKLLYTDTKTYLHELLMKQDQMMKMVKKLKRLKTLE
jgi:hypothetical protein